ncbi:hypothetical protein ACIP1V_00775 [Kocuria marina]|uniref:hypothetical protein n=1 Tax=Kocuria marina TaxID=223184 RepID=UPI00382D085A
MTDRTRPLVGRAATPEPPGMGSTTLGDILSLDEWKQYSGRRAVIAASTSHGRQLLDDAGLVVFPAVPGLVEEAVRRLRPGALILDATALEAGPWSGALTDAAPELGAELIRTVSAAIDADVTVYWVGEAADGGALFHDVVTDAVLVVAPGSELYAGTEEGAPASRLVRALRSMAGRVL